MCEKKQLLTAIHIFPILPETAKKKAKNIAPLGQTFCAYRCYTRTLEWEWEIIPAFLLFN